MTLAADIVSTGAFEDAVSETLRRYDEAPKYLGLAGEAGAGKDYVWMWLVERSRRTVKRVAYADGVRAEIAEMFGFSCQTEKQLFTKPYSYEVRRLLQFWGTELRRADDPEYWVKRGIALAEKIGAEEPRCLVVFTDVRFSNEADAIHRLGGMTAEVVAPESVRTERVGMKVPAHTSEEIDFETDALIENGVDGAEPVVTPSMASWLEID